MVLVLFFALVRLKYSSPPNVSEDRALLTSSITPTLLFKYVTLLHLSKTYLSESKFVQQILVSGLPGSIKNLKTVPNFD